MRRYLVAGNWKMNTLGDSASELAKEVADGAAEHTGNVDVLICPPFPYLTPVVRAVAHADVLVGAQDAYFESSGAFTGEVSVEMIKDVGCRSVILGHSERRHLLGESDELCGKKVRAALDGGLKAILCVGELLEERDAEQTESVLDRQMETGLAHVSAEQIHNVIIAYEPVWAIGTGRTASPEQAESAHAHLRGWLENRYDGDVAGSTRILYGGSVKPANAKELMSQGNVDGALVGGASLSAGQFVPIIQAAAELAG